MTAPSIAEIAEFITENSINVINVSKIKKRLREIVKEQMFVKLHKIICKSRAKETTHGNTINLLVQNVIKAEFRRFGSTVHKLIESVRAKVNDVKDCVKNCVEDFFTCVFIFARPCPLKHVRHLVEHPAPVYLF